ncbi:MAG: peroxide stress protein YaaA [Burkholderiaceae bacterium]|nr:peroxide stress protein YaaA [Burkholderiaceae bacterium]
MLMVISPAKTLDFDTPPTTDASTQCDFLDQAAELIKILRPMGMGEIAELMDLSDKLAALNAARFGAWKRPFTPKNAKQAVLTFDGDVYDGLAAKTMTKVQLDRAQKHLRILSGLYGVLRPLDLMQPYRLEMGTALPNARGKDLYAFWGNRLGEALNETLGGQASKVLINLASDEYFKAVQGLRYPIVTPVFQEKKAGSYKIVSFHAKRARGLMVRYAIDQKIDRPEGLKDFDIEDYGFDAKASTQDRLVFRRG